MTKSKRACAISLAQVFAVLEQQDVAQEVEDRRVDRRVAPLGAADRRLDVALVALVEDPALGA